MPNITQLVNAISADVVAKLAIAGYPPLTDGAILIGRQHIVEQSAPPRIVFIPLRSSFQIGGLGTAGSPYNVTGAPGFGGTPGSTILRATITNFGSGYTHASVTIDAPTATGGVQATATATVVGGAVTKIVFTNYGSGYQTTPNIVISGNGTGASAVAMLSPPPDAVKVTQQRSVRTETVLFEVHCWGQQLPTPDPNSDFDATQALYQQVILSTHLMAVGAYTLGDLTWTDQQARETQLWKAGHEAVFTLELKTPVLDQLLPLVPAGTVSSASVTLQPADGTSPTDPPIVVN